MDITKMKNKKKVIILPSIMIAFVAIFLLAITPVTLLESHALTMDITTQELYDYSDLAIIATYSHEITEETGIDSFPLRSIVTVNVSEVLKGTYNNPTLEIIDEGEGISYKNGYVTIVSLGDSKVEYPRDQQVILFFEHSVPNDEGEVNVLGEGYYLIGRALGMFVIDDNNDNAIHIIPERSTTVQNIRDILQSLN